MWTAAPADEADPARQASVTGTAAVGPAAMHAERGQRLAELILAESRQTGQGRGGASEDFTAVVTVAMEC